MDDHNVPYHFECIGCGTVYYVNYDEMVEDGWKVEYHKGYVCPCCTKKFPNAVALPMAQRNRKENGWKSLVEP